MILYQKGVGMNIQILMVLLLCMSNNQTLFGKEIDDASLTMIEYTESLDEEPLTDNSILSRGERMKTEVYKKLLANGMTVLVREMHTVPKVSIQLFYGVGSRDEELGEKGVAHLIEHMVFKGTDSENGLSESDINDITHLLSGSCNAFTSFDYTGYLFNFPSHNWAESLSIMAECMEHCAFEPDKLNSEMKAVIQELKMYKDRYFSSLIEKLMSALFAEHPYHYPIIGFKRDLWTVSSDDLKAFYKKHYVPNNATLVVVGDVKKEDVFALAEEKFGAIKANPEYKRQEYHHEYDIASQSVQLYRDVVQPLAAFVFLVPGLSEKTGNALSVIERVLARGRSSRLYKKLVNELQIVTSLEADCFHLFDPGLFFIICEPRSLDDLPEIEKVIKDELLDLAKNGIQDDELARALKKVRSSFYDLLEGAEEQANEIGIHYLATGDENYVFATLEQDKEVVRKKAESIIRDYLRPSVMHKGAVLPLCDSEKEHWAGLQQESDEEDARILAARTRTTEVEPARQAKNVVIHKAKPFMFPKSEKTVLKNGMKLFSYNNTTVPKIHIVLQLKARSYYDPEGKEGISNFIASLITEGTKNYTANQLADLLESRGMSLRSYPEGIALAVLKEDLVLGLEIIKELVTNATFDKKEISKIRTQICADIKQYWDDPRYFADQLIRDELYKNHPFCKPQFGTQDSIASITRDDLLAFYHAYYSPQGATLAVVGDLSGYNVCDVVEETLGDWTGPQVKDVPFPSLKKIENIVKNHVINRDQVTLCFAQLSVDRLHPDYDSLHVYNQIFGSGVLGSMSSQLFQLREQSGLFYSITGNYLVNSNEQPGMFLVKTLVSIDRLEEAKNVIMETVKTGVDSITQKQIEEAQRAIINSLVDRFADNESIANTFLAMDRFNLPDDYYDKRADSINTVNLESIKKAVKKVIGDDTFLTLQIGRMQNK